MNAFLGKKSRRNNISVEAVCAKSCLHSTQGQKKKTKKKLNVKTKCHFYLQFLFRELWIVVISIFPKLELSQNFKMSCFENVTMPSCIWFEGFERRNILASITAGVLVCIVMIHYYITTWKYHKFKFNFHFVCFHRVYLQQL